MKVQEGTSIKALREIKSDEGESLSAGSILTIAEPNYFGIEMHLAFDGKGAPWAIDGSSIDSKNEETNEFTVMEGTNA